MGTTPIGLRYPEGNVAANTAHIRFQELAEDVDGLFLDGLLGDIPDASTVKSGTSYLATDTSDTYRSDGTNWYIPTQRFLQGTTAGRPAAAVEGRWYFDEELGRLWYDNGTAWERSLLKGDVTMRQTWTYTLPGDIAIPSGSADFLPPTSIAVPTDQTITIIGFRWFLGFGTSFTFSLTYFDDMEDVTGTDLVTGIVATSAARSGVADLPTPQVVVDGSAWAPVVTAVSGAPAGGSVGLIVDVTV